MFYLEIMDRNYERMLSGELLFKICKGVEYFGKLEVKGWLETTKSNKKQNTIEI